MPPARHRHCLTDIEKGEIIVLSKTNSHGNISRELALPRRTVSSFLGRVETRHSPYNLLHPGRPRKTSNAFDRWLVRAALTETSLPLKEFHSITNIPVSEQTVRRRLRENGIRKWRALKRPLLNKEQARKRLEWAKAHRHWTVEDWAKVVWSDESAIQKDSDTRTVWVWRHQNKAEKYMPKNVLPKARDGRLSQMMWGCFVGDKLGPIAFIDGSIKKEQYIAVLDQCFLEFIDALGADGLRDIIFQQDNASPHTANLTRDWLKDAAKEHGFTIMDWPPNSPDMNPIEHLWAHVKRELHRRYPDTKYLLGSPAVIRRILKRRLFEVWWAIGAEVLNGLVESMPDRVRALIKAKGWYTEY
jgi:transposase